MAELDRPYARVADELAGTAFARIRYVDQTGSTNHDAAALLGDESAAGTTIVAEHQTHGSGRKGRSWLDRPGSCLLFTTILPLPTATAHLWAIPFWTALAVAQALEQEGVRAELHWPNDLLLGGAKLAGILCVSRSSGSLAWAACGVGINVTRGELEGVEPPPAFCSDAAPVRREDLLRSILRAYDEALPLVGDPAHVARLWEARAGLPGRRYRLLKDDEREPFEATAVALAEGGGLVVERADGVRETISLADARALRTT